MVIAYAASSRIVGLRGSCITKQDSRVQCRGGRCGESDHNIKLRSRTIVNDIHTQAWIANLFYTGHCLATCPKTAHDAATAVGDVLLPLTLKDWCVLAWHSRVTGGGQHFTSSSLRLSLFSGRESGHHIKIHPECSLFTLYFPSSIFYCPCSAPLRVSAKPSIVHHREATLDRKCGLCLDVRAAVQHCSMMRKADRGDS